MQEALVPLSQIFWASDKFWLEATRMLHDQTSDSGAQKEKHQAQKQERPKDANCIGKRRRLVSFQHYISQETDELLAYVLVSMTINGFRYGLRAEQAHQSLWKDAPLDPVTWAQPDHSKSFPTTVFATNRSLIQEDLEAYKQKSSLQGFIQQKSPESTGRGGSTDLPTVKADSNMMGYIGLTSWRQETMTNHGILNTGGRGCLDQRVGCLPV